MNENYNKLYFACDTQEYMQVLEAIKGLDARETETTFDQGRVYFYLLIGPKDLDEFNRRLGYM